MELDWLEPPLFNQPMAPKTSIKVGGPVDYLITTRNTSELLFTLKILNLFNIPWFLLGKGSNLLIKDEGFPGAAVLLKGEFQKIVLKNDHQIIAGAGVTNKKLTKFARENGLSGIEFLSTIPGTVGGAVYMNAGAYGKSIKDVVSNVEYCDKNGNTTSLPKPELGFSYRRSFFTDRSDIILTSCFELVHDNSEDIKRREMVMIQKRKETQPIDKHTWGSVFLNPPNHSAGQLIDSCDLKGKGSGKARISPKHANFIENTGGATFQDLMKTIELARIMVFNKYGIKLEMEGRIYPR